MMDFPPLNRSRPSFDLLPRSGLERGGPEPSRICPTVEEEFENCAVLPGRDDAAQRIQDSVAGGAGVAGNEKFLNQRMETRSFASVLAAGSERRGMLGAFNAFCSPLPMSFENLQSGTGISGDPVSRRKATLHKGKHCILLSNEELKLLNKPLELTLIGKFPYARPKWLQLQRYFMDLKLKGAYKLSHMDSRHFVIHLTTQDDYTSIFSRTVTSIYGFTVMFLKWSMDFNANYEPSITPIWISMSNLCMNMFTQNMLYSAAEVYGKPLLLDYPTATGAKPNVARVLVEMDLLAEHPEEVQFGNDEHCFMQKVTIERKPKYCAHCRKYGHVEIECYVKNPDLGKGRRGRGDVVRRENAVRSQCNSEGEKELTKEGNQGRNSLQEKFWVEYIAEMADAEEGVRLDEQIGGRVAEVVGEVGKVINGKVWKERAGNGSRMASITSSVEVPQQRTLESNMAYDVQEVEAIARGREVVDPTDGLLAANLKGCDQSRIEKEVFGGDCPSTCRGSEDVGEGSQQQVSPSVVPNSWEEDPHQMEEQVGSASLENQLDDQVNSGDLNKSSGNSLAGGVQLEPGFLINHQLQQIGGCRVPEEKAEVSGNKLCLINVEDLTKMNILDMCCMGFEVQSSIDDEEDREGWDNESIPPHRKMRRHSWGEEGAKDQSNSNKKKRGRKKKGESARIIPGSPRRTRGKSKGKQGVEQL